MASTMLEIGRTPAAVRRLASHSGDGPGVTPVITRAR